MDFYIQVLFGFKIVRAISWFASFLLFFDYSLETLASWQYSWRIAFHEETRSLINCFCFVYFFKEVKRYQESRQQFHILFYIYLIVWMVCCIFHHVPQQKIPRKKYVLNFFHLNHVTTFCSLFLTLELWDRFCSADSLSEIFNQVSIYMGGGAYKQGRQMI